MDKRKVLECLKAESRSIEGCTPFPALHAGTLSQEDAGRVFAQYRIVSIDFPKVLCAVAARLSSDQARLGIISNLWDEHGRGDIRVTHRAMLDRFLRQYNVDSHPCSSQPSWQTRLFLNSVNGIATLGTISEAVGLLLFFEAATPAEYRSVISWITKCTKLNRADYEFWSDHVEHDGDHLRELLDNTVAFERIEEVELMSGVRQARNLETTFWSQFANPTSGYRESEAKLVVA